VYKHVLDDTYFFKDAIKFFAVSALIRAEYKPLYFKEKTITLPFIKLVNFLIIFVDRGSEIKTSNQTCSLRVHVHNPSGCWRIIIDLKRLMLALLDRPGVQLDFQGGGSFDWEASSINNFVAKARVDPRAWCIRAMDFESIKMDTRTDWYPGQTDSYTGYYLRRPSWSVKMVIKSGVSAAWWDDEQERAKQALAIQIELGMREMIDTDDGSFDVSVLSVIGISLALSSSDKDKLKDAEMGGCIRMW
jgi:hypothetical protein